MTREDHLDRRTELLCDRALHGLDREHRAELEALLGSEAEDESLDWAAAAVALAGLDDEPVPEALRASLVSQGERWVTAPTNRHPIPVSHELLARAGRTSSATPSRWAKLAGWLVAAAFLGLALFAWLSRPVSSGETRSLPPGPVASVPPKLPVPDRPATLAEAREELLRTAKDAVVIPWSATKDAGARGASGDVVWSSTEQRGYMRFRGLTANDPRVSQFQLWIFDRGRDDRYPVDGGVFDVDARTGDVIVAITPRLRVAEVALFAVTVEPPGGVVVSKREHIVLTAAPRSPG